MLNSGADDVFFIGDLEKNTLRTLPAPRELRQERLEVVCVPHDTK
jgi:hypothetical protein